VTQSCFDYAPLWLVQTTDQVQWLRRKRTREDLDLLKAAWFGQPYYRVDPHGSAGLASASVSALIILRADQRSNCLVTERLGQILNGALMRIHLSATTQEDGMSRLQPVSDAAGWNNLIKVLFSRRQSSRQVYGITPAGLSALNHHLVEFSRNAPPTADPRLDERRILKLALLFHLSDLSCPSAIEETTMARAIQLNDWLAEHQEAIRRADWRRPALYSKMLEMLSRNGPMRKRSLFRSLTSSTRHLLPSILDSLVQDGLVSVDAEGFVSANGCETRDSRIGHPSVPGTNR
jgi:hypothetical protein